MLYYKKPLCKSIQNNVVQTPIRHSPHVANCVRQKIYPYPKNVANSCIHSPHLCQTKKYSWTSLIQKFRKFYESSFKSFVNLDLETKSTQRVLLNNDLLRRRIQSFVFDQNVARLRLTKEFFNICSKRKKSRFFVVPQFVDLREQGFTTVAA